MRAQMFRHAAAKPIFPVWFGNSSDCNGDLGSRPNCEGAQRLVRDRCAKDCEPETAKQKHGHEYNYSAMAMVAMRTQAIPNEYIA